jgi:hypothetical protein
MRSESFAASTPRRDAERGGALKFGCNQVAMEFRELGNFGIQVVLFRVQLSTYAARARASLVVVPPAWNWRSQRKATWRSARTADSLALGRTSGSAMTMARHDPARPRSLLLLDELSYRLRAQQVRNQMDLTPGLKEGVMRLERLVAEQ